MPFLRGRGCLPGRAAARWRAGRARRLRRWTASAAAAAGAASRVAAHGR